MFSLFIDHQYRTPLISQTPLQYVLYKEASLIKDVYTASTVHLGPGYTSLMKRLSTIQG